jgi:hypothetical protein
VYSLAKMMAHSTSDSTSSTTVMESSTLARWPVDCTELIMPAALPKNVLRPVAPTTALICGAGRWEGVGARIG